MQKIEELKKLRALLDQGALDKEEYEQLKAKVLGGVGSGAAPEAPGTKAPAESSSPAEPATDETSGAAKTADTPQQETPQAPTPVEPAVPGPGTAPKEEPKQETTKNRTKFWIVIGLSLLLVLFISYLYFYQGAEQPHTAADETGAEPTPEPESAETKAKAETIDALADDSTAVDSQHELSQYASLDLKLSDVYCYEGNECTFVFKDRGQEYKFDWELEKTYTEKGSFEYEFITKFGSGYGDNPYAELFGKKFRVYFSREETNPGHCIENEGIWCTPIINMTLIDNVSGYTDGTASVDKENVKGGKSFYILNTMACAKETNAVNATQKLIDEGYRAGYLWIPDYNSLSGKEYYTVYIGPFYSQYECEVEVEKYRKIQPTAYGLIVNQEHKRVEITGVGKVKVTYY